MSLENETNLWAKAKVVFAPPLFEDQEKTRIAALLNTILLGTTALILLILPLSLLLPGTYIQHVIVLLVLAVLLFGLWLVMRRGYVRVASIVLVGLIVLAGTANIYIAGTIRAPMGATLILAVIIARLLINNQALVVVTVLCVLVFLGLNAAETAGMLPPSATGTRGLSSWLVWTGILAIAAVLLGLTGTSIERALAAEQRSAVELRAQRVQLQTLVEERTEELARRTAYLGATTAIAHEAAAVQHDLQALFDRVVSVISDQFGFYHTGLFLVESGDASSDEAWVVLRAASSEGGQRMIARGHRLRVGRLGTGQGIVGDVAARGQYRSAQDVGREAVFFNNPDLPETRSEIALPLQVRDKTIGVLDVQSRRAQIFSDEDRLVLQALADQVAVAINNVQLLQQVEESLESERRIYSESARDAWQALTRTQASLGFLSDARGIVPLGDVWEAQMKRAARTGQIVSDSEVEAPRVLAIPILVRGEVVGVIDGRKPDGSVWTTEEIDLLQTLTEQLGVALESARLYQDSQRRANRERLVGEVTTRMRESLELDAVLNTAADEIRQAMGLERLVIRMQAEDQE